MGVHREKRRRRPWAYAAGGVAVMAIAFGVGWWTSGSRSGAGDPIPHIQLKLEAAGGDPQHPPVVWLHDRGSDATSISVSHVLSSAEAAGGAAFEVSKLCLAVAGPGPRLSLEVKRAGVQGGAAILGQVAQVVRHGSGGECRAPLALERPARPEAPAGEYSMCCLELAKPVPVPVGETVEAQLERDGGVTAAARAGEPAAEPGWRRVVNAIALLAGMVTAIATAVGTVTRLRRGRARVGSSTS